MFESGLRVWTSSLLVGHVLVVTVF
ncbi:rCG57006, isoform CRA_b [Rattus norvegicus]|uniref:RCG57006, isoform CRA_b n=1 Tax=Rattus norvegicus TaxID=10116 RepID=A6JD23_RAT|nr:rCG57006, isoform CRA_b [Rattus norvegicus]